jgi:hypothetical protein
MLSANLKYNLAKDFFVSPEVGYMRSVAYGASWGVNIRLRRSF